MDAPFDPAGLEIPVVEGFPEPSPRHADPVALADHLLTAMLRHPGAMLHADFAADDGRWLIRARPNATREHETVVAVIDRVGVFRSVLARFGHHYMGGQVYGGYTEGEFTHRGVRRHLIIHMGNDSSRGFWIRVYAR